MVIIMMMMLIMIWLWWLWYKLHNDYTYNSGYYDDYYGDDDDTVFFCRPSCTSGWLLKWIGDCETLSIINTLW